MKERGKLNLAIDALLALVLAFIAGIGLLIKFVLPSGRDRILKSGGNAEWLVLGMDRHQWGAIHLAFAYALIVLMALHIYFHWKTIVCLLRRAIPSRPLRRWIAAGFTLAAALLLLFPFLMKPDKSGSEDFLYRNARLFPDPVPLSQGAGKVPGLSQDIPTGGGAAESVPDSEGSVEDEGEWLQGRMTITDVARYVGISTAEVKSRLELPSDLADGETIGRLRRVYRFTMEEARRRLTRTA